MGEHRRKADGRVVFRTECKRTTVQRILTGEKTLAELSRELDISPSVISWLRTRDRAGGRYLGTPRKSGLSRSVRAANLSFPPEQKIGEHSTDRWWSPPSGASPASRPQSA